MNIRSGVFLATAAFMLAGCAGQTNVTNSSRYTASSSTESQSIETYYVEVAVAADGSDITINTDTECKDDSGNVTKDCVEIAEPDYAQFIIELVELDGDTSDDWRFKGMVICREGQKAFTGCPLSKPQRLEFVATESANAKMLLPSRRGRIDLSALSATLDEFNLWDQNNLRRQFEYGIMVCPVGDEPPTSPGTNPNMPWDPCLVADPKIKNKGRGRR